jgi:prepilin-type N-terminal cleavage/methylation domain-containing protein
MRDERGFTLVEFMIAAAIMAAVLGGTVMLATQLQQVYSTQLDDATVEEEVRFTLDWIGQALRNAGSDPYTIGLTGLDVNAAGDELIVRADINPPDGVLDDENEDVTIALDADNRVITREDNVTGGGVAEEMTEPVITGLVFTLFDSAGNELDDTEEDLAAYVRVRVTGQSQAFNTLLGENRTTTLETEVRVRTRE